MPGSGTGMPAVGSGARFEGAVVLVTGAGQGIGRGIAHRFAREGAQVAVLDREAERCSQVVGEIVAGGGRAFAVAADLGNPEQRSRTIGDVLSQSGGRLDVVVNNAAVTGPRQPLDQLSDAEVREVIEVNLIAPLLLCRDALPALAASRGAIVLVSSIQVLLPLPTFVTYVSTKAALEGLTRALAVEMAGSGVRVNAVAPGAVESPAMREQWAAATGTDSTPIAPTLAGRWGTDADIAEVVAFLSSPASAFVSGEVIRADGGRLLSRDPDPLVSRR